MKPTPSILSDRPVPANRRRAVGLVLLLLIVGLGTCLTRPATPPLAEAQPPSPASVVVPPLQFRSPPCGGHRLASQPRRHHHRNQQQH